MKLAIADMSEYVGDPDTMRNVTARHLLDKAYLHKRATDRSRTRRPGAAGIAAERQHRSISPPPTQSGMMVSFIQSNYKGFGSGVVVPDTGIALQNRAFGFSLKQGHPNEVAPGKRPFHTIIPGFVTKGGAPLDDLRRDGRRRCRRRATCRSFSRIVDHGQNPQAAIDAPRWRVHESDGTVWTEEHMPADTARASRRAATGSPAPGGRASISARARSSGSSPRAAPISAPPRAGATARPSGSRNVASKVTIDAGGFRIAGQPTYPGRSWKGHRIEGLLFNSRMANAIADDENPRPAARGPTPTARGTPSAARASSSPPCPTTAPMGCWRSASTSRAAARRATPGISRGRSAASRPTDR